MSTTPNNFSDLELQPIFSNQHNDGKTGDENSDPKNDPKNEQNIEKTKKSENEPSKFTSNVDMLTGGVLNPHMTIITTRSSSMPVNNINNEEFKIKLDQNKNENFTQENNFNFEEKKNNSTQNSEYFFQYSKSRHSGSHSRFEDANVSDLLVSGGVEGRRAVRGVGGGVEGVIEDEKKEKKNEINIAQNEKVDFKNTKIIDQNGKKKIQHQHNEMNIQDDLININSNSNPYRPPSKQLHPLIHTQITQPLGKDDKKIATKSAEKGAERDTEKGAERDTQKMPEIKNIQKKKLTPGKLNLKKYFHRLEMKNKPNNYHYYPPPSSTTGKVPPLPPSGSKSRKRSIVNRDSYDLSSLSPQTKSLRFLKKLKKTLQQRSILYLRLLEKSSTKNSWKNFLCFDKLERNF
jgi:hypothetical protein